MSTRSRLSALKQPIKAFIERSIRKTYAKDIYGGGLDVIYGKLINGRHVKSIFHKGWGNLDLVQLEQTVDELTSFEYNPGEFDIEWNRIDEGTVHGVSYELLEGSFITPTSLRTSLPPESKVGRLQYLKPTSLANSSKDNIKSVIHLPGTGDTGFSRRIQQFGYPLLKHSIGSILLETPYCGSRRPKDQTRSKLNRVSDLLVMGRVTVEETLYILNYMRCRENHTRQMVAGFSLGGVHATMVNAVTPVTISCLSMLAPHHGAESYCRGPLWEATELYRNPTAYMEPTSFESSTARHMNNPDLDMIPCHLVKHRLEKALDVTDLLRWPVPRNPEDACFVAAKQDRYVPIESVLKMHHHWKGSKFITVEGGHVWSFVTQSTLFCDLIIEALKDKR